MKFINTHKKNNLLHPRCPGVDVVENVALEIINCKKNTQFKGYPLVENILFKSVLQHSKIKIDLFL